jgi:ribonuclease HI
VAEGRTVTITWHVWTDGSCLHGPTREERANAPRGLRGSGGYAAVVEHGSDSWVRRGHVTETTNVRMELLAAIEGLRSIDGIHQPVILHTDATTIISVRHAYERDITLGTIDFALWRPKGADADLWRTLAAQLERHDVTIDLLGRGSRPAQHKRAHAIAGAEARELIAAQGIPGAPVIPPLTKKARRRIRKKALDALAVRQLATPPPQVPRVLHHRDCVYDSCVSTCPVLLYRGGASAAVYESRRRSEARRLA